MFSQTAEFSFNKKTKRYNVIEEGDTLKGYFIFQNKGNAPLLIKDYSVECHCTDVTFPSTPIPPQASDTIFFTFDSNGKYYQQDRTILIFSNAKKEIETLRFKVYVNPKEEESSFQSIFKR